MKTYQILRKIRKYTKRTQTEIARRVHITQQALQRYEKTGSLPASTIGEISKHLHIDPEYMAGKAEYPFKSDELIKMFVKENIILGQSLDPMHFIAGFNKRLSVIYLTIQNISKPVKKDRLIAPHKIYAVTFRDEQGNLFLLRQKKENKTIDTTELLPVAIHKILSSPCLFSIAHREITPELYEKIKNLEEITRKDIEELYEKSDFETYFKNSDEETEQIEHQRELKTGSISKLELIIIHEIRKKGLMAEEALRRMNKEE